MVEVRIQQAALEAGIKVVFREYADLIRVAHDPAKASERDAIEYLQHHVPRARGELRITRLHD